MGYPAELWVFDENKIKSLLDELKSKNFQEFVKNHESEIKGTKDSYEWLKSGYLESTYILRFKEDNLKNAEFLIYNILKISSAKLFDLYEFNHYQYMGFWKFLLKTPEPKGFAVIRELLSNEYPPTALFDLSLLPDTSGFQGYLDNKHLQEEGKDAIQLLTSIKMTSDNIQKIHSYYGRGDIDDRLVNEYTRARDKIVNALEFAIENKMSITLHTS